MFEPPREEKSPAQAVISEALARRLFPGEDPIGRFIGQGGKDGRWIEVTGVVGNVRRQINHAEPGEDVYLSHRSLFWALPAYVIATEGDPTSLIPAVRTVFRQVDPNLPLGDIMPLATSIGRQTRDSLVLTSLMGGFALAALILAAIGLYGLLARDVTERTQEIGVRLALGADPGDVLRLTLRRGAGLAGTGLALGAALAVPFARLLMTELPPGAAELQWSSLAGAAVVLVAIALAASYWPARRAARVDPLVALRHD
jgi:putative ABC transport system permease protein